MTFASAAAPKGLPQGIRSCASKNMLGSQSRGSIHERREASSRNKEIH